MSGALVPKNSCGDPLQLWINPLNELIAGLRITGLHLLNESSYFTRPGFHEHSPRSSGATVPREFSFSESPLRILQTSDAFRARVSPSFVKVREQKMNFRLTQANPCYDRCDSTESGCERAE